MPIGLVAGCEGVVSTTRAVQLYNAIPAQERAAWRIRYFDGNGAVQEYTRADFNNVGTVVLAAETHCVFYCHGSYSTSVNGAYRSTGLSRWDISQDEAIFDTQSYIDWLQVEGVGITTIIVAACHAGDIGIGGGNTPIQQLIAVRPGIQADGPNSALLALNYFNVNWNLAGAPNNWTRF